MPPTERDVTKHKREQVQTSSSSGKEKQFTEEKAAGFRLEFRAPTFSLLENEKKKKKSSAGVKESTGLFALLLTGI